MGRKLTVLALAGCLLALVGCRHMKEMEKQNVSLQSQLRSLEAERSALLVENQTLKAARDALEDALTDARAEARRLSALVGELQAEQGKLQQQALELKTLLEEFGDFTVEARHEGNFIVMPSEILFAAGKTELNPEAQASLDKVAQYLREHPGLGIRIDGHTDEQPIRYSPFQDNYHLGAMRAHSVMTYLAERGVGADRMFIAGFGPNRPRIEPPEPAAGVVENRRVEILLLPEGARSITEILEGFSR